MREINFRVWDPVQHKMLRPDYLEFISGVAYWVEASTDGSQLNSNDGPLINPLTKLSLVLEQYTGLKDVNGKPIYEGDILKVTADDGDSYLAPVKYGIDQDYPAFDLDGKYVSNRWDYESNRLSSIAYGDGSTMSIVGNIHENKDLLEGGK